MRRTDKMNLCGPLIGGPVISSPAVWGNPDSAGNFLSLDFYIEVGVDSHMPHDERYDRADHAPRQWVGFLASDAGKRGWPAVIRVLDSLDRSFKN